MSKLPLLKLVKDEAAPPIEKKKSFFKLWCEIWREVLIVALVALASFEFWVIDSQDDLLKKTFPALKSQFIELEKHAHDLEVLSRDNEDKIRKINEEINSLNRI